MADVALSAPEVSEVLHFLDSLAYEYDLIAQDLHTPSERRSYRANATRSRSYATVLAAEVKAARGATTPVAHVTLAAILGDFVWLREEWHEAMKAMDDTDRANYQVADRRLATLLATLTPRVV